MCVEGGGWVEIERCSKCFCRIQLPFVIFAVALLQSMFFPSLILMLISDRFMILWYIKIHATDSLMTDLSCIKNMIQTFLLELKVPATFS